MSLFTRARRHVDMNRVKEMREKKIKEETIAEVKEQQEEILAELKKIEIKESPKYSNWRRELTEQMTTVDMGMINLPGMGDANLADFDFPVTALGSSPGYSQDGNNYTFGPASAGVPPAETASLNIKMNSEKYDTIVFDFVAGTIDHKLLVITGSDGGSNTYELSNTTGRKELRLLPSDRKKSVSIAFNIGRDAGGGLGTNKMLNMSFRRVAPMNLVVGLDDPEANSFIRGGLGGSEERRKQLKDMLEAGNEWMVYNGLEPSKTTPGDIAVSPTPYSPGTKYSTKPDGSQGFPEPGELNKGNDGKWYEYGPGGWVPIPSVDAGGGDDTMVAGLRPDGTEGFNQPGDEVYDPATKKKYKLVPRKGYGYNQWIPIEKAGGGDTMVAHYEPQYSNWRRELQETITMSTNDIMTTTLPAAGDVDLESVSQTATPGSDNSGGSDGTYSFGDYDGTGNGGFTFRLDTRKYDTLKFSASGGNATRIELSVGDEDFQTLSSGTNTITISSANRGQNVLFTFNAFKSGGSGATEASISGTAFQRRTNISTGIRLDDPDANAFVRMGDMNNLSAEERKAKLKDMLYSGNEYLTKYTNVTPSQTAPGDIELAGTYNSPGDAYSSPNQIKWPRDYRKPGDQYPGQYYDKHMKMWVPVVKKA